MKKIILYIFASCLALTAPAQGFFEATLGTPPEDNGALLSLGKFWFKVENGEVDFIAYMWALNLNDGADSSSPILSVPGSSVEFSLGEAQMVTGINEQIIERNPFLPASPLEITGYDDDGNPYYFVVAPPPLTGGTIYSGHFDLPPGFLDELLADNGKIQLNSSIVGNIIVNAVPEPSTLALVIVAGGGLFLLWQWKFRDAKAQNSRQS